jgi:PAS domain S-box-containing protein
MLREHPRFARIAVIFVSAMQMSEMDRLRGYETGAVDYLPVPINPQILRAKVKIFIELYRKTRQLEGLNYELEQRVADRTGDLVKSIDRLRESEERMRLASEAAEFGTYDYHLTTDEFHCSAHLRRLLGVAGENPLRLEEFLNLIHPADQNAIRDSIEALRDGETDRHEHEFRVTRADGAVHWLLNRGRLFQTGIGGQYDRLAGTILDIGSRKQVDERHQLLMAELDHRVKNVLANIGAMARLSSLNAGSVEAFVLALGARIRAISLAHNLLQRAQWGGADLAEIVETIIQPSFATGNRGIEVVGAPVALSTRTAQSLALVLHELTTNAFKHGALSVPAGKVTLTWERVSLGEAGHIKLEWRETGGPPVSEPKLSGFGMTALRATAVQLDATLECNFAPQGLVCTLLGPFESME